MSCVILAKVGKSYVLMQVLQKMKMYCRFSKRGGLL